MRKLTVAALAGLAMVGAMFAQSMASGHKKHEYNSYEKLVYENVSQFHKNFNAREFVKNGDLVTENIHVDSKGTPVDGREAFVNRIQRFVVPFPDVHLEDRDIVVDGNMAAVYFEITGTQKGDLDTGEGVIAATNKPIHVAGAEFFTFDEKGKVTNLVTVENLGQLLHELKAK